MVRAPMGHPLIGIVCLRASTDPYPELLAERFSDELASRLPSKRKLHKNEDSRMDMFGAVGLAVVSKTFMG